MISPIGCGRCLSIGRNLGPFALSPHKSFTEVSTRWPRDKRKVIRKSANPRRKNPKLKRQHLCSPKGRQRPIKCQWASVRVSGNWVSRWLGPDQAPPADKRKPRQDKCALPRPHHRDLQSSVQRSAFDDRPSQIDVAHLPPFPTILDPLAMELVAIDILLIGLCWGSTRPSHTGCCFLFAFSAGRKCKVHGGHGSNINLQVYAVRVWPGNARLIRLLIARCFPACSPGSRPTAAGVYRSDQLQARRISACRFSHATTTSPVSKGWRRASNAWAENSGNLSGNKTP